MPGTKGSNEIKGNTMQGSCIMVGNEDKKAATDEGIILSGDQSYGLIFAGI